MTDDDVIARLDRLEADNQALRAELDALRSPLTATSSPRPPVDDTMGRRHMLRAGLAAAGAATAGALVVGAEPAAAANGSNMILGRDDNTATNPTGLSVQGNTAIYGLGVTDNGSGPISVKPTIFGHAKGQAFTTAIYGLGTGTNSAVRAEATGNGVGVNATSASSYAVLGESAGSFGVYGRSERNTAGRFETASPTLAAIHGLAEADGGAALSLYGTTHAYLLPKGTGSPSVNAATSRVGELRWTSDGLYACVAKPSTATWLRITGPSSAGAFHLLPAPVRAYDSRPGTQPAAGSKTPLPGGNAPRGVSLRNGGGVPPEATGVLVTVLLVNASAGNGNFTIWQNGVAQPAANTMVWGPGGGRFSITAATRVASVSGAVNIAASLQTDVVLDVVGYYR